MKTIETLKNLRLFALLFTAIAVVSCSDDDEAPEEENLPEVFTNVTLIFTPEGGGAAITAEAEDPDGTGAAGLELVDPAITLATGTTYTLTFNVENRLDPNADLNAEIKDEDDEHQIFFAFTDGAFSNPTGDGNIGAANAAEPINYNDEDSEAQDGSGNPVGLSTTWTTSTTPLAGGSFTANLQHQPGVKTATSTSENGDTDFDLTFTLNIQ
ncbi:MAG: GTP cyclohydrolase [Croceivirga sp.]